MSNRSVIIAVFVIVPLIYGLLYWLLSPTPSSLPITAVPAAKSERSEDQRIDEGRENMLSRLKTRVERNPADGEGWALLARSYVEAGQHAEAVSMYEHAVKLLPEDPQVLADYADALGVLQGRKLDGKPQQLIQQALKIDPNHIKALRLAGTASFNRKEFGQAVRYWERAHANLPDNGMAEVQQELLAGIAEARELVAGMTAMPAAPVVSSVPNVSDKQAMAISGTVTLAPGLKGKAAAIETVFVFAREVNGPPMPVAIMRVAKQKWPFTFRLDDSLSPMPTRKLSDAGEVLIIARLSKSGEAMPKSGDLQGQSQPVRPGATRVDVIIDRELP